MASVGSTTPKLIYFDFYGRAEPIRIACSIGGGKYVDERIDFADFGKRKMEGEFAFGSVPVWIEDGVQIA